MSRLFISLFFYITLALTGFVIAIYYLPDRLLDSSLRTFQKQTYQGTVYLLNQRLLNATDKDKEMASINAAFGYDVQLISLSQIDIDDDEKQRLADGEISFEEIDGADYLYYPSALPEKIWLLQTDQTYTEDYQRGADGTIKLIEDILKPLPETQWRQQIVEIAGNFGFRLTLEPLSMLELPDDLHTRVLEGELISQFYDSSDEQYYSRVFDSDYYIHAGPVRDFWFEKYLIYTIIVFLGILVSIAILIWVIPLWRSLISLDQAATELGEGNFDTRVESRGFAPIKKITSSFNLMADHIQNLVISHKDLTNAVSHELRTPLARLRFGLEMMQSSENEDRRAHYFKEMNTDIEELETLISELLSYARIERDSHAISFQPCELLPWLEEQTQRLSTLAKDKKLVTNFKSLTTGDKVQLEPKLMARALSNLTTNAIRHAKSVILVSASIEDELLRITVDDDGSGISPDIAETIFEPFKRGDISRDRDTGGFGLGLGIVRQILGWHKGKVEISQSELGGARFTVKIPVKNKN